MVFSMHYYRTLYLGSGVKFQVHGFLVLFIILYVMYVYGFDEMGILFCFWLPDVGHLTMHAMLCLLCMLVQVMCAHMIVCSK
jgi:hypothetical protein